MRTILDNLPFGVSLQDKRRIIFYENDRAKTLLGSFHLQPCHFRWNHIETQAQKPCTDCPATMSFQDNLPHKVFRKTIDKQGKEIYLEIECIPLLNAEKQVETFIEIIKDVTGLEKLKPKSSTSILQIVDNLRFGLVKYGTRGGEHLWWDEMNFFGQKANEKLMKLVSFMYIGIFQNNFDQRGLFGPLPVLDELDYMMLVYSGKMPTKKILDNRNNGKELILFFIIFKREDSTLFRTNTSILEILEKHLNHGQLVDDMGSEQFGALKAEIKTSILDSVRSGIR